MLYTLERALSKITKARPAPWPPPPARPHEHEVKVSIPHPPDVKSMDLMVWRVQRGPLARVHDYRVVDAGQGPVMGVVDYDPELGETGIFDLYVIPWDDILASVL